MSEKPHPPYPPTPPYPPQAPAPQMPPRPAGVPPMGQLPYPHGVKMPPGMKMPPRPGVPPMGGYPVPPGGMKMPPRPMGMPPAGGAVSPVPVPPAGDYPQPQVPLSVPAPSADVSDEEVDEMWGEEEKDEGEAREEIPEEEEELGEEEELEIGEDGIIDDLAEEPEETEAPSDEEGDARFEASPYDDNLAADLGLPPAFIRTKVLLFVFVLFALLGAGVGFFFGISQNQGKDEMPGVVNNAEIPKGRPRCGIAAKGQGCVLYLMNAQRREMEAKEFFGYAADILGIPKFQIETANIRYATMRIPPGYIALFNIPPVQ